MLKDLVKSIFCEHEYVEVCRTWTSDKNRPHEIGYECVHCYKYVELKMFKKKG